MISLHRFRNAFRLAVLISAVLFTVAGARSEVLTSFWRAALSDQIPEGWRFSWSSAGPLEQGTAYSDLTIVESNTARGRRLIQRGVLDEKGALREDAPGLSSNGAVNTSSNSAEGPKNEKVHPLNAKIRALADDMGVFYLDVGPSLAEPDRNISPEVTPDRLHVAMPGFLRWMEVMKPTLEGLLPNQ